MGKDDNNEKKSYSYEEFCKIFKSDNRKKQNKNFPKIFVIVGLLIGFGTIIYSTVTGVDILGREEDLTVTQSLEQEEKILVETEDKGAKLQLNEVKVEKNKLNLKMTLDYNNLENNEFKSMEVFNNGNFEVFIGDEKVEVFKPSVENTFSQGKTTTTIKADLDRKNLSKKPLKIVYICEKLDIGGTESKSISGNWNFTYEIKDLSDIEQGEVLKIEQKSNLVNDELDIMVNFDYIVNNEGKQELVYCYENRTGKSEKNYDLEVRVLNDFGVEILNSSNSIKDGKEPVKRIVGLELEKTTEKIIIIPKITKSTFIFKGKIVVEGKPMEVDLKQN